MNGKINVLRWMFMYKLITSLSLYQMCREFKIDGKTKKRYLIKARNRE